jgi:hypothetical protein
MREKGSVAVKVNVNAKFREVFESTRIRWRIPGGKYLKDEDNKRLLEHTVFCVLSSQAHALNHATNGCGTSLECHRCGASLAYDVEHLSATGTLATSIQKQTPCPNGR